MRRWLRPDVHVSDIGAIDVHALADCGVRGLIVDLDNTLVSAHTADAPEHVHGWMRTMRDMGMHICIVSNNDHERVARFAAPLHVPFVAHARKPSKRAFDRARVQLRMDAKAIAVIGDQLLTDVLGAKRCGMYVVLVDPISKNEEAWWTRNVNRRLERCAKACFRLTP